MKNVYFIQVGVDFGNTLYLPYAAGAIIANCLQSEEIAAQYRFPEIIFTRDKLNTALARIDAPYMAAFSCNIWNVEYNKALAKRVKERYPECVTVFGGHSVGTDDTLLRSEEYIDILVFGEGETVFAELLKHLPQGDLENVASIAYRENGQIRRTPDACPADLASFPSPFTAGIFDSILEHYPHIEFSTVMETNRGCPYSCAFCDWTHGRRMRLFPMEKIRAEVQWIAAHKIPFVYCGDSNFGLLERDLEIVDIFVNSKKETGYPEIFRVNYEKNSTDRVFRICKTLNEVKMDKGATMSYQSLSPAALKNIGRVNLTMEHFSDLMRRYTEAGIATYSELILGFPGETYESFCKGICTLIENGQHSSLFVYLCEILPNSEMADPAYIEKHKIQTIKVYFQMQHSVYGADEEVHEYSRLVRATDTMDPDAWVASNIFSICVQCFHSFAFLRFFAIYLYEEGIADYFTFYTGLVAFLLASPGRLGSLWRGIKDRFDHSLQGDRNYYDPRFGNITWLFEEGAFLEAVTDTDGSVRELLPYLRRYDIPQDVFSDLLSYQTAMLRKLGEGRKTVEFAHDIPAYFASVAAGNRRPLEKKPTALTVMPAKTYTDPEKFAREVVWYGRRKEASLYGRDECEVS